MTEQSLCNFCLWLTGFCLSLAGTKLLLILARIHETDILEFVFPHEKNPWLAIIRKEKCACLQTCGLKIAYNSHITVCHQNTSAWQDQSYCHPFTFNFNLHEIMFFLLHFFQFFPSLPLFIFPYHFKVTPFSNVSFSCYNVLTFTRLINALFLFHAMFSAGTLPRGRIKLRKNNRPSI
jgi:hypothetical protein